MILTIIIDSPSSLVTKQDEDFVVVVGKQNKRHLLKSNSKDSSNQSSNTKEKSYQLKKPIRSQQLRQDVNKGRERIENNSIDRHITSDRPPVNLHGIYRYYYVLLNYRS